MLVNDIDIGIQIIFALLGMAPPGQVDIKLMFPVAHAARFAGDHHLAQREIHCTGASRGKVDFLRITAGSITQRFHNHHLVGALRHLIEQICALAVGGDIGIVRQGQAVLVK